jgi:peptidoglycan/xylan/chitin deacetylase (PgdA/CDA1 family)
VVALTFDAGGNDAGVDSILATLSAQHVPATFFLTGRWSEVYPRQSARIAAAFDVGDHTYSHPHLTQLSDADVAGEITRGEQAIRSATGHDPHPLFRFPYGDSDVRTLRDVHALGYGGIRWTVDTWGWKGAGGQQSADTVVSRVLAALTPGAIVLMHVGAAEDGSTLDADALSRLIGALRARGYGFATVADYVG